MSSLRPGSTLIEAILAVVLLGILVLSTVPVVHQSRAASSHAVAVIETAVLAEHLANSERLRSGEVSGGPSEGTFDPPFEDYYWSIATTRGRIPASVVTVRTGNAATTIVVAR